MSARRCTFAVLALALGLAPRAVHAQATDSTPPPSRSQRIEAFRAEQAQQAEQKAHWQELYRKAIERERKAETRLENARAVWSRGRGDDRLRGEPRARALAEVKAAEKELAEARSARAAIPEEARQAGALPGWLREVELDLAAAPAAD
jgi:hypothetical protein